MESFKDRVVLITGGASGIGLALAAAFLASGARVLVCGRDEGRLAAARRELPGVGAVACDVTVEAEVAGLVDDVQRRFGRLDVLVNNAGRMSRFDFNDAPLPAEPIAEEIAVNLTAPILVTNLALPLIRRGGAVVMMGSGYGWVPAAHAPVYSAAKAGVRAFAKALRLQLEAAGIAVMEVVPPVVATPATAHLKVRKVSADEVARETLRGLRRGAREVFVGRAKAIPIGLRLAPRLLEDQVGRS